MMKVTPIVGEKWRYYVHSETHGDENHVVDLAENGGNGSCSCRDFETRCGPEYHRNGKRMVPYRRDEKGKTEPGRTHCKHIREVRDFLLNSILPDMVAPQGVVRRTKPVTVKNMDDPTQLPF